MVLLRFCRRLYLRMGFQFALSPASACVARYASADSQMYRDMEIFIAPAVARYLGHRLNYFVRNHVPMLAGLGLGRSLGGGSAKHFNRTSGRIPLGKRGWKSEADFDAPAVAAGRNGPKRMARLPPDDRRSRNDCLDRWRVRID